MDDFLHNLRNQSKKPFDRNRSKPYDGQFRSNDRFAGRDRNKSNPQRKPADSDHLPAIKRLIEGVLEQQRKLVEYGERAARAAERQAEAIESISRYFQSRHHQAEPDSAPASKQATVATPAEASVACDESDTREAAADIILQQREGGQSFEQIAQVLNTRGIATVSGKGQWRAQSVSRLYNTLVPAESAGQSDSAAAEA